MEKIVGTLPSQMGFRQPDGGEGVMDIPRGRIRCSHFSQRKGVLGCYFDCLVGRHQPRLPERFCGSKPPFLWGVKQRNACSREFRRIGFSRGLPSPSSRRLQPLHHRRLSSTHASVTQLTRNQTNSLAGIPWQGQNQKQSSRR